MANRSLEKLYRQARQVRILEEKARSGSLTPGQQQDLEQQRAALRRAQRNYITEKEAAKWVGEVRARRIAENRLLVKSGIFPDLPLDWGVPGGTPREYQRQNEAEELERRG